MESTKQQLSSIMEKYDIGKKPLSRLLGWGETTIMRYLDGAEPNKEFAARIEELFRNPWKYEELLERRGDVLTDTAYKKTRRATYRQMFCDKSTEAVQYVVSLAGGDISPFRAIAVLYYAQVFSLVHRGLPIFEEEASVAGRQKTPYPRLYDRLMQYGVKVRLPQECALTAEDKAFLESVFQLLNGYSPNALHALWKREGRQLKRAVAASGEAELLSTEQLQKYYGKELQETGKQGMEGLKAYVTAKLKGR